MFNCLLAVKLLAGYKKMIQLAKKIGKTLDPSDRQMWIAILLGNALLWGSDLWFDHLQDKSSPAPSTIHDLSNFEHAVQFSPK
jgi:hypothetical protein